jgi:hypothetical protein
MEALGAQVKHYVKGYSRPWGVRLLIGVPVYDILTAWLKKQCHRTEKPIGHLAEKVSMDSNWPKGAPT